MNCRSARQLISPYLDHQLTGREMLELQEHFSHCVPCAEEMHSILQVKCLLRGLHAPDPRRDLSDTISVRLKEAEVGTNGWRVLSLPPTLSFTSLTFSSLTFSSSFSLAATRPPRGRRLATALGLSCLTILSIAAPFAPASRDGAHMTSGLLSSAFLMPPMAGPSLASLPGPETTNSEMLNQASAQTMPVGAIDLTGMPASTTISQTTMSQSDFVTLTHDELPLRRPFSVFPAPMSGHRFLPTRLNVISPADYSR